MPRAKAFDENETLLKAVDLFWCKGYHATSMQDLVDHLGINRASLYDTFGSKRDLFIKALTHYRSQNKNSVTDFLEKAENPLIALRTLFDLSIEESMNDTANKGCFVVNTSTELAAEDPEISSMICSNKSDFQGLYERTLDRSKSMGLLAPHINTKGAAAMLFALYNGLKVMAKANPQREELIGAVQTAFEGLGR